MSLGLPGAWGTSEDAPDPYANRVGGDCCIPTDAADLFQSHNIKCGVCGLQLSLLLQVMTHAACVLCAGAHVRSF